MQAKSCGLRPSFSASRKAMPEHGQNQTLGAAQTRWGKIPQTPYNKLPHPPHLLGGSLAGRQESNDFDSMPRGSGTEESVNSLSSFRYRFIPVPLTDANCSSFITF